MAVVYHWKHGWIPLTHAAALAKAHGNHKLAEKLVPSQRKRRTPQHVLDYHAARQAQDRRFEAHAGGGISASDTHTQEYKDYFGVGDHSTSGRVEERITYRTHLRDLSAMRSDEQARTASYNAGVKLGIAHHGAGLSTDEENRQYDAASARVQHEDHFDQGYADGMAQAYERGAAHGPKAIATRRDLAGAITTFADVPKPKRAEAKRRIQAAAKALDAQILLPASLRSHAA